MNESHIVDAGGYYQLVTHVRLPTMFSIVPMKMVWQHQKYVRKIRVRFLNFSKIVYDIDLISEMSKDITDDELHSRKDMYFCERPLSAVYLNNLPVYREPSLSNSSRSVSVSSVAYSQPSRVSTL